MPSLSWTSLWSPASQLHHNTHHSASAVPYPCRDVLTYRVCQETWSELRVSMWTRTAAHCLHLRNQTPNCGNFAPESHATKFSQPKEATQRKMVMRCWGWWGSLKYRNSYVFDEALGGKHLWIWRKTHQHFPPENRPQEESSFQPSIFRGWKTVSWEFPLWKKPGLPTDRFQVEVVFSPSSSKAVVLFVEKWSCKDDSPRFKQTISKLLFLGKLKKGVKSEPARFMGSFKKILFNSTFL